MLGWLRSNDRYEECLRIGPDETTLASVSRTECEHLPVVGVYSDSLGERVLFYRWEGRLCVRIGSEEAISISDCEVAWQAAAHEEARFVVRRGGQPLVDTTYAVDRALLEMETDPTAFAEPEDFDIYLFIANVVNDTERAGRIFR